MDTIKVLINHKHKDSGLNIYINIIAIGIFIFTFYISTLKSFLFPFELRLLILMFSIVILFFSILVINKKGILITRVDIMWLLFLLLFVTNISFNNIITPVTIIDIFVYTSGIVFLLLVKVNISNYDYSLKLVKLAGIIYACSAIFQYLYTDFYLSNVLPFFSQGDQDNILKLLRGNSYTGFTNQTAHLAGYIVSGIGVIIFSDWKKKLSIKFISILYLTLLVIGLLLTTKRAHFIFMIIAIVITVLFSINNKKFIKNVMKLTMGGIVALLFAFFLFTSIEFSENSPIVSFVNELDNTVNGIIEGEDVSSGRSILYTYSWDLFTNSPITGIGWKEFINNSVGLINSDVGSHPHNIYLQLLTELGIVGFFLFISPVIYVYYKTYSMLRIFSVINNNLKQEWKFGIQYSFFSQSFFLLYGMTGNLLTDYNFLLMYFLACSISLSAMVKLKTNSLK
ncbi:O-antigen ligase family protein [Oceanobacillus iheyensis]|uniref:O-antigen ligase family protein n=1 Tax=Oceanobacillus iheyensis TaxID=182710 RepID=UPI00363386A1